MSARERIFAKLNAATRPTMAEPDTAAYYAAATPQWDSDTARIQHWARTMRSVKTEIYWVTDQTWPQVLCQVAQEKNIRTIALPTQTPHGQSAQAALREQLPEISITPFDRPLEDWKDELFQNVDAGFTDVRAGIAQTGTLLLWPDVQQPRSLSLVPPIHIALFDVATLYPDFFNAMQGEHMAGHMPTNVVLVSGPSKTDDIQLTLAYGAHGPRDLVVLAKLPPHIQAANLEEDA